MWQVLCVCDLSCIFKLCFCWWWLVMEKDVDGVCVVHICVLLWIVSLFVVNIFNMCVFVSCVRVLLLLFVLWWCINVHSWLCCEWTRFSFHPFYLDMLHVHAQAQVCCLYGMSCTYLASRRLAESTCTCGILHRKRMAHDSAYAWSALDNINLVTCRQII